MGLTDQDAVGKGVAVKRIYPFGWFRSRVDPAPPLGLFPCKPSEASKKPLTSSCLYDVITS
jgi:hypothetical protein